MTKNYKDSEREQRIDYEIIVDAYNEEERAMGWYYYVENKILCPFKAICISSRQISVLEENDEVKVIGLADESECMEELFVLIDWNSKNLAVPLDQLKALTNHKETIEAIEDWHYWVARGYQF